MNGNNLYKANKNENNTRIMFSVICILALLIVGLCVYLFVFSGKEAESPEDNSSVVSGEVSREESRQPEQSETEPNSSEVEPVSQPEQSQAEPVSQPATSETEVSTEPSEPAEESSEAEITEHGWDINALGYTYLYYGIGLEQFTFTNSTQQAYTQSLNTLYSLCGNSKFYNMLIPTRCEFIDFSAEIRKEFYTGKQRTFMNNVFEQTDEGIVDIDLYDVFKTRFNEDAYIYFNTDPNYTHLGAYIAYTEFCKAAGIEPVSETLYTQGTLGDTFYGKFFTATRSEMLLNNPDILFYYDVDEIYKSDIKVYTSKEGFIKRDGVLFFDVPSYGYYCFLSSEASRIDINTKVNKGKKCLLIGDSSAAPFATLLVPHYDLITYINTTISPSSILDLLSSQTYDDVIVINYNTRAADKKAYEANNTLAGIVLP